MKNDGVADLLIKAIEKIIRSDIAFDDKIAASYELLVNLCKYAIRDTGIQFHTVFSIIAYAGHQYNLPGRLLYNIHRFRKLAEQKGPDDTQEGTYRLGLKVLSDLSRLIFKAIPTPTILSEIPGDKVYLQREASIVRYERYLRALFIEHRPDEELFIAILKKQPDEKVSVRYNLPGRNELFTDSIRLIGHNLELPLEVNLIDVEVDDQGEYLPKGIIMEPDFLVDITSIAECFKDYGVSPGSYLVRKFVPVIPNKYLMLGNIANFFLDEIMANPDVTFKSLINRVFTLNPLAFSLFDDATSREIVQKAQKHFNGLKTVVHRTFGKVGIKIEDCFLEPTFYSEQYGIQGRLDVLHDNPDIEDDAAIVELKSGMPFKPNSYGLSYSHYVQTLLYDLLIRSSSEEKLKPTNYILYSGKDEDHLRFAPAVRSQQYEALAVRNELLALDFELGNLHRYLESPQSFTDFLREEVTKAMGFTKRDLELLVDQYDNLSSLEQKYFLAMTAMTAREHHLAKTGVEGSNRNNGQAALWINSVNEKVDQFSLISFLTIVENRTAENEPVIILRRSEQSNDLANFRQGDLALLYPVIENKSPLSSQLFKGSIVQISAETVSVRLRAKQFNDTVFQQHPYWNIEHDMLDSSFNASYRALFTFSKFDLSKRQKFLTIKPPAPGREHGWAGDPGLTLEQNRIMGKILASTDYFLLWGPPGTGKTSVMLKTLVRHLLNNTEEEVMVLAYTNRAVDEICCAMHEIEGGPESYLRIGSRYSTDARYVNQLLVEQMRGIKRREDLRQLIASHRIIVGTVSSVLGKPELFTLKSFDRLIVDEATQILEPMMAGLIPHFDKALLIGDHRQLAAVVAQPSSQRTVHDPSLLSIGMVDVGNSYFERVYHRCQQEEWSWAYDHLSMQGRMHRDIMGFPGKHFYNDTLQILSAASSDVQTRPLSLTSNGSGLQDILATKRFAFLPVISDELYSSKTNEHEASLVARIVSDLLDIYQSSGRDLTAGQIGIITPFRAQIAMIKNQLSHMGLVMPDMTIDTVERFQGGARDIIIISLCVNSKQQLDNIVSMSSDGVDRKLNVALTRAREQLIILGDPTILSENEIYAELIREYQVEIQEAV